VYIPGKEKREELRRESVKAADAVRLAKSALEHGVERAGGF
jgi:hypothetical protein